jgi:hypothetical protein
VTIGGAEISPSNISRFRPATDSPGKRAAHDDCRSHEQGTIVYDALTVLPQTDRARALRPTGAASADDDASRLPVWVDTISSFTYSIDWFEHKLASVGEDTRAFHPKYIQSVP